MRRNFLLTIALAVTGVLVVVGSAGARGGLLDSSSSDVGISLPGGEELPPLGTLPQCSNLDDDDGDGSTDLADPDCAGPLDNDEAGPTAPPEPEPPPPVEPPPGPGTGPGGGNPGGGGNGGSGSGSSGGGNPGGGGGNDNGSGGSSGPNEPMEEPADRNPDGSPTDTNPTLTVANFGPAPMGVPNFLIDQFSIPPFLLP
ncbi:MAG: hypothetical protein ACR2G3_04475, partial [Solirubrobacterales bacterium]